MGLYGKYVLPHVLSITCGARPIRKQRAKVVPLARGSVLELGLGPGHNLEFYDPERVSSVVGVDPSPELEPRARRAAARVRFPVEYLTATAETMPIEDRCIDTLVVTYTLCTIPDPLSAMEACRRVLKPDAEVLFCEHGAAPDAGVAAWQRRINPIWKRLGGGCNVDRPIPELLERSGYRIRQLETMYLPSTPRFAGFNYWGTAEAR